VEQQYFAEMLSRLATRAGHGTVSWLGFSNVPLRRHLMEVFDRPYGDTGSFLADPTFEAVFGWRQAPMTMSELSGKLLHPRLVEIMNSPAPKLAGEYRFPKTRQPYEHQLKAWQTLCGDAHKSVVVTSGTGSGKTECFLVPILDQLVREQATLDGPLIGVRALFLYPLNALINSQRDRLSAWTHGLNSKVRFCLYNGMTPELLPMGESQLGSEILDRKTLRKTPPPILVTNATMLEYMLVRTQDTPILQTSQGKLQWIVLDEAHTYIGSQAAELALLIRRVLHAFGVKPEDVRFVATSATIGDPKGPGGDHLREFLARISGNDVSRIELVSGQRSIPELAVPQKENTRSLEELCALDQGKDRTPNRYDALASHPIAKEIRRCFTGKVSQPVARLSDVCQVLFGSTSPYSREQQREALRWLDLVTSATSEDGTPFLPLRSHLFHQTLAGLWCCADANCPRRSGSLLDDIAWPFGAVYLEPRKHCSCGSPVYELVACNHCGAIYLHAEIHGNILAQPESPYELEDFTLDEEENDSDVQASLDEPNADDRSLVLVANRNVPDCGPLYVDRDNRSLVESTEKNVLHVDVVEKGPEGLVCPECRESEATFDRLFRTARVGAPFYLGGLLPTLLEFAQDGVDPATKPYRGRRLLTFTDSRQGTARLAARLQQDAERTKTRGLIYHNVLAKGRATSEAEEQIRELEKIPNPSTVILNLLEEKRQSIRQSSYLSFRDLQLRMQKGGIEFDTIRRIYESFSRPLFGGADGNNNISEVLVIREMGRRPRRQNNLETMGLVAVCYPKLEQVNSAPPQWTSRGRSDSEWKDFLKIAVDHFIRSGGSLEIRDEIRQWLGIPYHPTCIVSSAVTEIGKKQRRWPCVQRSGLQSKLVRLLANVFAVDIFSPEGQDIIDSLLEAAWSDCKKVLKLTPDGYVLPLEEISFSAIQKAWVCPVTRRLMDATLCGVTPYLLRRADPALAKCQQVNIPIYDAPFGNLAEGEDPVQRGRAWLESQTDVGLLRQEGLWSVFQDRVIEYAMFFASAEHSAQQPASKLADYEQKFKAGAINVLSCSTTMELGIDIGGVQQVAMNNVPPHPANYLQRAGRAGRRHETRSTALTLCKPNPHDQNVFLNTRWAFDTVLPAPVVSLNSAIIVQRHVNSVVLAMFLRKLLASQPQDLQKLTCGWFFTIVSEQAPCDTFASWCESYVSSKEPHLELGLNQLVRHTIFEGQPVTRLINQSGVRIAAVAGQWQKEWNALLEQEVALGVEISDPAVKAIAFQKTRLSGEYLLRELATDGFLPAYGFPAFVASFDNLTLSAVRSLKPQPNGRGDTNRFMRRDLASRDLVTALREYAPGAEIVMDGLVYRSAGITLNWHVPASEADVRETQAIRFAWRCGKCGSSGTTVSFLQRCEVCGAELESANIEQFLEPAGFAVDFYDEPSNDVSNPVYLPVERPWVSARGDWSPLPNPKLGSYRVTTEGRVYHHSKGANGTGYAICLECGRAEPLTHTWELPKMFAPNQSHYRLRSRKEDRICSGSTNRWAIKTVALGHELHTDMLELQLRDTNGQAIIDRPTATTLAVALRDSLAALLGVQSAELGCDARETRDGEGSRNYSIFIFDRFAAGYASSAERLLREMFIEAAKLLACPKDCESSCPHCVLDFDQRFEASVLDRRAALKVLNSEWLKILKLPAELCYFGDSSHVETSGLINGVITQSRDSGAKLIRLFADGEGSKWDFASSTLRHLAYKLVSLSRTVEIFFPKALLPKLGSAERFSLASIADHPGVSICVTDNMPKLKDANILAEVHLGNGVQSWACSDPVSLIPSNTWGQSSCPIIVGRATSSFVAAVTSCSPETIRPEPILIGDQETSIHHQLDGEIKTFGARFWNLLCAQHHGTKQILCDTDAKVLSISYSDRYLFTPVSIALLRQILAALSTKIGPGRFDNPTITVSTSPVRDGGEKSLAGKVYSDWPKTATRDAVATLVLESLSNKGSIKASDKIAVQHGRVLEIVFSCGQSLVVRLDQGVGYWRVSNWAKGGPNAISFDFGNSVLTTQANAICNMSVWLEGQAAPTQVFTKVRNAQTAGKV
jgi:replicative superfamily II helicase